MKTHSFDGVSFFSGLVVTVIGLLFLIPNTPGQVIDAFTAMGGWFWPILFLAIGLAVIVPVLIPRKSKDDEQLDS